MSDRSIVRVGVVGCGYWGPNLIRNFARLKNCEFVAAVDINSSKLDSLKRFHPSLRTFTSLENLLNQVDLDAVAIATPVSTHHALAKLALERGKHVLLEKPMTADIAQAEELIRLAEQSGKVLMVDHTFVYSGAVSKIRELIQSGQLGEIYYYDAVRVNLGLFQHDVDVLWDLGPHDFSIMAYLLDKKVASVSAVGARPVRWDNWKLPSIAYVTIQFTDGTLAHFHLNWLSPVKVRRALIGGSRKMVVYDHLDPDNQVKIFDKGIEVKTLEERSEVLVQYRMGDLFAPKVDQKEALEAVCEHFISCIQRGERPLTDGKAGLEVVRLLQAAAKSLKQDGERVKL
ncbi:MAG: Gfo/Idh/MocA family oxidoreductase [Candidatus Omnitrophica bacterium]|nr:Gfo/Idh/MocA family oxidoreductase [Candidatus Omnitrophota bacterium]